MKKKNTTRLSILLNMLISASTLFVCGFGIFLTIHANIGAGPWEVLNIGISKTTGILYGTASIAVSLAVLVADFLMKEPIGISLFINSFVIGKTVDFFNWLNIVPTPKTVIGGILMMIVGLVIIAFTMVYYIGASLGAGPRDTLLVGLKKRITKIPIGMVSICLLVVVTAVGWLLGGPVGIGTLIFAFGQGPILQVVFKLVKFDPTTVEHQNIVDSFKVFIGKN